MTPREFTDEVYRYREYSEKLQSYRDEAQDWYSNIPTVFGEFGTYWNFNGIEQSVEDNYIVSTEILDNYYEAYEDLMLSNMVWCYTADNDYTYGDWWNHEDFSIIDPAGRPRGETAYSRPVATAISGKPTHMHFYSDHHYYDPDKGEVDPFHEFELRFASRGNPRTDDAFRPRTAISRWLLRLAFGRVLLGAVFPGDRKPDGVQQWSEPETRMDSGLLPAELLPDRRQAGLGARGVDPSTFEGAGSQGLELFRQRPRHIDRRNSPLTRTNRRWICNAILLGRFGRFVR